MGLFFLLTVGLLVRGLSAAHRGLAHGLLSSRYETQQRLLRTQESRAAGRTAESTALRRLERDLHDGPQQRLVRATMDLARAESLAAENPEKAGEVMRQTREQLGLTLDDLRRLSRGTPEPASMMIMWPASMVAIRRSECVSGRTMKFEMISSGTSNGRIQLGTPLGTTASLKYLMPW